jgi:hypothetical protein
VILEQKFRKWCTICSLQSSPATSTTVVIYIGGLIQQGVSVAVLESHFYAIKWYHDFNFTSNPCSNKVNSSAYHIIQTAYIQHFK